MSTPPSVHDWHVPGMPFPPSNGCIVHQNIVAAQAQMPAQVGREAHVHTATQNFPLWRIEPCWATSGYSSSSASGYLATLLAGLRFHLPSPVPGRKFAQASWRFFLPPFFFWPVRFSLDLDLSVSSPEPESPSLVPPRVVTAAKGAALFGSLGSSCFGVSGAASPPAPSSSIMSGRSESLRSPSVLLALSISAFILWKTAFIARVSCFPGFPQPALAPSLP